MAEESSGPNGSSWWQRQERWLALHAPVVWQTRRLALVNVWLLAFDLLLAAVTAARPWESLPPWPGEDSLPTLVLAALLGPPLLTLLVLVPTRGLAIWWRKDWFLVLTVHFCIAACLYLGAPFAIWSTVALQGDRELADFLATRLWAIASIQLGIVLTSAVLLLLGIRFGSGRLAPPRFDFSPLEHLHFERPRLAWSSRSADPSGLDLERTPADYLAARLPYAWSAGSHRTLPLSILSFALLSLALSLVPTVKSAPILLMSVLIVLTVGPVMYRWSTTKGHRLRSSSRLVDGLLAATLTIEFLLVISALSALSLHHGLLVASNVNDEDLLVLRFVGASVIAFYVTVYVRMPYLHTRSGFERILSFSRLMAAAAWSFFVMLLLMTIITMIYVEAFGGIGGLDATITPLLDFPVLFVVTISVPLALVITGGRLKKAYFAPRRK